MTHFLQCVQGSTIFLKRKFSASQFWDDCRTNNVTVVQYIGEVMRYLCSTPKVNLLCMQFSTMVDAHLGLISTSQADFQGCGTIFFNGLEHLSSSMICLAFSIVNCFVSIPAAFNIEDML